MGTWVNVLKSHLHLVIPVSYLCHYTNLCPDLSQKRTHTHTHTHTHTQTDRQIDRCFSKYSETKVLLYTATCCINTHNTIHVSVAVLPSPLFRQTAYQSANITIAKLSLKVTVCNPLHSVQSPPSAWMSYRAECFTAQWNERLSASFPSFPRAWN